MLLQFEECSLYSDKQLLPTLDSVTTILRFLWWVQSWPPYEHWWRLVWSHIDFHSKPTTRSMNVHSMSLQEPHRSNQLTRIDEASDASFLQIFSYISIPSSTLNVVDRSTHAMANAATLVALAMLFQQCHGQWWFPATPPSSSPRSITLAKLLLHLMFQIMIDWLILTNAPIHLQWE